MKKAHYTTWNIERKMKNVENETHTVGPGIWVKH